MEASASRGHHIYDLKRLLSKSHVAGQSRLSNDHLGFLLDQRRAKEIRDTFRRTQVIEPTWLQDYGIFNLTPVSKAEDKSIAASNCKFSKAELPPVVEFTEPMSNTPNMGTYSIRSITGDVEYNFLSATKFSLLHPDSIMSRMKWYAKIGNHIYLTPEVRKARALLVLDNPLDGYVLDNLYIESGNLVVGTIYEVAAGNITHNSIKYQIGQSFTAAATTFTGLGKVQYQNQKRRMTNDDPYPMSQTMAEVVKLKILTQDFAIEAATIADIKNDSIDDAIKR